MNTRNNSRLPRPTCQGLSPDVRTILFDVDGTLVDSNDAHAHAWVEAFGEHDVHVDFAAGRP
jgi:hypothetical protein